MNKNLKTVNLRKFSRDAAVTSCSDNLLCEKNISVFIGDKLAMNLVCTDSFIKELVVGRFISEGIIETADKIENLFIYEDRVKVILGNGDCNLDFSDTENVLSCCPNNKTFAQKKRETVISTGAVPVKGIRSGEIYISQEIKKHVFFLADAFQKDSKLHRETSGTHSCYVCVEGKIVFSAEDIGRHNAMDKAIGYIYMNGMNPLETMLFTTGRVPLDMVQKAINAKIGVLVSKSVPTAQAVELAKKHGLILICKAWPDSFVVYGDEKTSDICTETKCESVISAEAVPVKDMRSGEI